VNAIPGVAADGSIAGKSAERAGWRLQPPDDLSVLMRIQRPLKNAYHEARGGLTPWASQGVSRMHGLEEFGTSQDAAPANGPWWKLLNRYHWFVLLVAALGWLFDCLDQQLFILARPAAVEDLVPARSGIDGEALNLRRKRAGDIATSVFIAGWACGGLFFGMLGDRIGRAKTMLITILLYSLFTGLSSLSVGVADFAFYRFLTGLGVGGEFAVGVALVAEVMPAAARTHALALLQALSAFGNITAALINMGLGLAAEEGLPTSPWRIMFLIGALPALLALVIRRRLKEPEQWQRASHEGVVSKQLGSYSELFRTPKLRKHALLGLLLGCSGVIGLWSVGFYTPDLIRSVQAPVVTETVLAALSAEGQAEAIDRIRPAMKDARLASELSPADQELKKTIDMRIKGRLTRWQSLTSIMINIGAFLGMYSFGVLSQRIGRKPTFTISLLAAFVSTVAVFWFLREFWQIFVLVPIMGFCQLSLFGGYAVYFPELFPTRLRSTGTSFCYNVGRFLAATGPLIKTLLDQMYTGPDAARYTGITMCSVFLLGLFVLPFLPETKGQALPE
jgi:MFS family permease